MANKKLKTLTDLYNLFKAIPEKEWTKGIMEESSKKGAIRRCAVGHLRHALTGGTTGVGTDTYAQLQKLGVSQDDLINANDEGHGKKTAKKQTLKFIKNLIKVKTTKKTAKTK